MARRLIVGGVCLLLAAAGCGGPRPPAATGEKGTRIDTEFLRLYSQTWGFSAGHPTGITVTPDGSAVLFLRSGPRDLVRNLYELNTRTGEIRGLARAADLLSGEDENLSAEEKARRERQRVVARGIASYQLSEDAAKVLITLSGRLYFVQRSDGEITPLRESSAGPAVDAKFSPDGKFVSCIRGHDLYVIDVSTKEEHPVTTGGTDDVSHGIAEFVAQEEMRRHTGYWWSGDSEYLAFEECDQRDVEMLYIADPRNPAQPPHAMRYPRAGRSNARVRLGIVSVKGGATTWVDWDRDHYPYLATVAWGKDAPLTIYVQTRDQREAVLFRVDPATGKTHELLKETDAAWLNIDADMPKWLANGEEFLWTSERSGEWELELRAADGSLKRSYRPGDARMFGVCAVDAGRREVMVEAGEDPSQTHLYRIALANAGVAALTQGEGVHKGYFSREGDLWVDDAYGLDGSHRTVLRGRDATVRGELPSVADEPPFNANLELDRVQVGSREFYSAIVRPRGFVASRKYPVIVYVYGGPGHTMVTAASRSYLRQQWFADQGFVVVSFDVRGTPRRGREWERATVGNFIDIPLNEQAAALQALAAAHTELDLSRVGIYGWSFGGYFSAMAVCQRPDVFQAAVAGASVIDWTDYDTHYTERYLGTPESNAAGYRACSVLTFADQLQRPLLLVHGTTDDNVFFTHTLKMTEALFRAGRPHELLVLAGFTHMVPDPEVTIRLYEKMAQHFRENLVDRKPVPMSKQ